MTEPPLTIYQAHLDKGELAYQWDKEAGRAVFYPRLVSPYSGSTDLRMAGGERAPARCTATTVTSPVPG